MMMTPPPILLSIAGLDPSCGAGFTADLKTFDAHGFYGICCPTALTVQSTQGVRDVVKLETSYVAATLACLLEDVQVDGVKIGMLATAGIVSAVADFLRRLSLQRSSIVLDPVLRSTSGAVLLEDAGVAAMRERLLPMVGWITPNAAELAVLLNEPAGKLESVPLQASRLQQMAAKAGNPELRVVVTGGDFDPPNDYFLDCIQGASGSRPTGAWLAGNRIETLATHGTGCAFSSALLCHVVQELTVQETTGLNAVTNAKAYVTGALQQAYPMGKGKGPLNHRFRA